MRDDPPIVVVSELNGVLQLLFQSRDNKRSYGVTEVHRRWGDTEDVEGQWNGVESCGRRDCKDEWFRPRFVVWSRVNTGVRRMIRISGYQVRCTK